MLCNFLTFITHHHTLRKYLILKTCHYRDKRGEASRVNESLWRGKRYSLQANLCTKTAQTLSNIGQVNFRVTP